MASRATVGVNRKLKITAEAMSKTRGLKKNFFVFMLFSPFYRHSPKIFYQRIDFFKV
jgi:hypothetical protein